MVAVVDGTIRATMGHYSWDAPARENGYFDKSNARNGSPGVDMVMARPSSLSD